MITGTCTLGPLDGNTEKWAGDVAQVIGGGKMDSETASEVLKCDMFGGQNRVKR